MKKEKVLTCWFQIEFAKISGNIRELRPSSRDNIFHQYGHDSQYKQRKIRLSNFTQH